MYTLVLLPKSFDKNNSGKKKHLHNPVTWHTVQKLFLFPIYFTRVISYSNSVPNSRPRTCSGRSLLPNLHVLLRCIQGTSLRPRTQRQLFRTHKIWVRASIWMHRSWFRCTKSKHWHPIGLKNFVSNLANEYCSENVSISNLFHKSYFPQFLIQGPELAVVAAKYTCTVHVYTCTLWLFLKFTPTFCQVTIIVGQAV